MVGRSVHFFSKSAADMEASGLRGVTVKESCCLDDEAISGLLSKEDDRLPFLCNSLSKLTSEWRNTKKTSLIIKFFYL